MTPLSLQMFYESLPQPFPEALDGATAAEINAPAWLNMTVQSARGGRLKVNFVSLSERSSGCKSQSNHIFFEQIMRMSQSTVVSFALIAPETPKPTLSITDSRNAPTPRLLYAYLLSLRVSATTFVLSKQKQRTSFLRNRGSLPTKS